MNPDLYLMFGLAAVCLTIGLDLGARIMADTPAVADTIHDSLIALRLKHQDARVKADLAARAAQDNQMRRRRGRWRLLRPLLRLQERDELGILIHDLREELYDLRVALIASAVAEQTGPPHRRLQIEDCRLQI